MNLGTCQRLMERFLFLEDDLKNQLFIYQLLHRIIWLSHCRKIPNHVNNNLPELIRYAYLTHYLEMNKLEVFQKPIRFSLEHEIYTLFHIYPITIYDHIHTLTHKYINTHQGFRMCKRLGNTKGISSKKVQFNIWGFPGQRRSWPILSLQKH